MPGRQKACSRHWPGIQPAALAPDPAWDGSTASSGARGPTYLAPLSKHSEATIVEQLHSLRPSDLPGPGWRQRPLWAVGRSAVSPSLWGRARAGRREGAGGREQQGRAEVSFPCGSPWPLSGPRPIVLLPGSQLPALWSLAPPSALRRGRGPGPPPASKGRGGTLCPSGPVERQGRPA